MKVASEQQRKVLEDIVNDIRIYKDAGVNLQKWIAQKEKMVSVLGPVATDPSMVKNQLEQVKVFYYKLFKSNLSSHCLCNIYLIFLQLTFFQKVKFLIMNLF